MMWLKDLLLGCAGYRCVIVNGERYCISIKEHKLLKEGLVPRSLEHLGDEVVSAGNKFLVFWSWDR